VLRNSIGTVFKTSAVALNAAPTGSFVP